MKTVALCVIALCIFAGCVDLGSQGDASLRIDLTLVEGRLWADFRNPILPEDDNVRCEFVLVIHNGSRTNPIAGSGMPQVEIFLTNRMARIGAVQLYTNWSGYVAPCATDTVHLIKRTNQGPTLVPIPCDSMITFRIALKKDDQTLGVIQRDSVLFECYQ